MEIEEITFARISIQEDKMCYRNIIKNIWNMNTLEEIKNEIKDTISKINEIAFTKRLLKLFKKKKYQDPINKFLYYDELLKKKHNEIEFPDAFDLQPEKKFADVEKEFDCNLSYLFL